MPETSTLIELVRETADNCGVHEFGVSTNGSTTALTIADYPVQTNRTNASNKVYEGNELRLADAQGSSTIASSDMSATATTVTVASGASFAASTARPYVIGVDSELMLATLSSATFTILARGWAGTRAAIHAIGATIYGPARTPNPNGIGAYVASTGVLTPSVTWNASPGTTIPYDIFFEGVGWYDCLLAVNKALRELHERSKFLVALLPDGDMRKDGVSNWTAYGTLNASSGKVTAANAVGLGSNDVIMGPRSLRALATAQNSGYQSASILVDPVNVQNWFVVALVRANVGTATLRPYDVTNSANITVSGTQTWTNRGWGHIFLWFTLPATCQALAFRIEATAASDDIYCQYVAPYPVGATTLPLPSWVTRSTQIVRPYIDNNWAQARADFPSWSVLTGCEFEEDLGNPNSQVKIILGGGGGQGWRRQFQPPWATIGGGGNMVSAPIWLDAYRPFDPLVGDAQTAFCERELVCWMAASHLALAMIQRASGAAKTRWQQTYTMARKEARRVSLERVAGPEVVLG